MQKINGFPSSSVVNNPPAKQVIWVWSLGQENPLEEGMAAHSSILARKIPSMEEPGWLEFTVSKSWIWQKQKIRSITESLCCTPEANTTL